MKIRTMHYKTLKGLISKTNQFNLNNFFDKRFYHKEKGHINFSLSIELEREIENLFLSFLGLSSFNYSRNYGIFNRLIIEKDLKVKYIAGQDYPSEFRYIKKLLK